MASSEEIRAIREEQRRNGGSYREAQAAVRAGQAPDLNAENMNRLFAENAKLKADLDKLRADVAGMRVTGKGFSGQGPRGIRFNQAASADPNAAGGGIPDGYGEVEQVLFVNAVLAGNTSIGTTPVEIVFP